MKKLISLVLAVIIAFSCLSLTVSAADEGYTKTYVVNVAPDCAQKLELISTSGSHYVVAGESFSFTVEAINGYVFDQTTVLKVANTHYEADVVLGVESEYGYVITPDKNGVYTIEEVNEDLYIYVANLEQSSFADLKDFLLNMFNFFRDLMKWFFGV